MGNLFYDEPRGSVTVQECNFQIFDIVQWWNSSSLYRIMECHGGDRYDLAYIGDVGDAECGRLPSHRVQHYSRAHVPDRYARLVERDGRPVNG